MSAKAGPLSTLKHLQVSETGRVDLVFDHPVTSKQIRAEFFNDIVQLSITDAAVYPAKITSVSGEALAKVFAYQYAPRLVRVRFTVKGKAESFQEKVQIRSQGKSLVVRIGDHGKTEAVARTTAEAKTTGVAKATPDVPSPLTVDERSLLDRIVRSAGGPERGEAPDSAPARAQGDATALKDTPKKAESTESPAVRLPSKSSTENSEKTVRGASEGSLSASSGTRLGRSESSTRLTGGRPLPSPWRSLGALLAVVGLLGLCTVGLKRFKKKGGGGKEASSRRPVKGLMGFLKQFTGEDQDPLIEVMATQVLGPKQSLTVVRVGDRQLVLGTSGDSMRLITEMPYVEGPSNQSVAPKAKPSSKSEAGFDFAEELERLSRESDEGPSFLAQDPSPSISKAAVAAAGASRVQRGAGASVAPSVRPQSGANAYSVGAAGPSVTPATNLPTSSDMARTRIRSRLEGLKQL